MNVSARVTIAAVVVTALSPPRAVAQGMVADDARAMALEKQKANVTMTSADFEE
jgi:hypothetical protein